VDNVTLDTALEKLRGTADGDLPQLTENELKALSAFLANLVDREEKSESEQLLCSHIRRVLQALAMAGREDGAREPYTRTKHVLRAAIERILEERFSEITEKDLRAMGNMQKKLAMMAEQEPPSTNEVRLSELLGRCLDRYNEWAQQQTGDA